MEIRKINDTTIRCIITQQDLEEYEIDLDDLIEHRPRAMQFLRSVMDEAARKENVRVDGPFTSMQIRVLKDHSICLTLTQGLQPDLLNALREIAANLSAMVQADNEEEHRESSSGKTDGTPEFPFLTDDKSGAPAPDSPAFAEEKDSGGSVYVFVCDTLEDVIAGCRCIPDLEQQDTSLYYLEEDRAYYLMVLPGGCESGYERALLSMNEFGDFYELTAPETAFITEHGTCILKENAVRILRHV